MKKSQRTPLRTLAAAALVILAYAGTPVTVQAAYIVNATETGGDVVFEGAGSLDLTAWTFLSIGNYGVGVQPSTFLSMGVDGSAGDSYYSALSFAGPAAIGPGTAFTRIFTGTGDLTGIEWTGSGYLTVPAGYTSGSALTATVPFAGQTFSSLGLTPGNYEWTWGTGASFDSFTLNVGAVPVPAAVWLFGSGLLGLVGVARRKARA